jgi:hypothetical protein
MPTIRKKRQRLTTRPKNAKDPAQLTVCVVEPVLPE